MNETILSYLNYENPSWEDLPRTHEWRRYVGVNTRAIWQSFSKSQKYAIALDAQDRADMEDWD